jgi:hypothetical protein
MPISLGVAPLSLARSPVLAKPEGRVRCGKPAVVRLRRDQTVVAHSPVFFYLPGQRACGPGHELRKETEK